MDSDIQEALSHQHSHGLWVVALQSERFALFDHPNGKLIGIVELNAIADQCHLAALHREAKRAAERPRIVPLPKGLKLTL